MVLLLSEWDDCMETTIWVKYHLKYSNLDSSFINVENKYKSLAYLHGTLEEEDKNFEILSRTISQVNNHYSFTVLIG